MSASFPYELWSHLEVLQVLRISSWGIGILLADLRVRRCWKLGGKLLDAVVFFRLGSFLWGSSCYLTSGFSAACGGSVRVVVLLRPSLGLPVGSGPALWAAFRGGLQSWIFVSRRFGLRCAAQLTTEG